MHPFICRKVHKQGDEENAKELPASLAYWDTQFLFYFNSNKMNVYYYSLIASLNSASKTAIF